MTSPLYTKAFAFSERILKMSDYILSKEQKPKYSVKVMAEQVTRSGTSIGANIAEAKGAQSDADMASKLSISRKEAFETRYWLDLLLNQAQISETEHKSMLDDLHEIILMLGASVKTLNNRKSDK